jgi:UDP-N-acetylmuramoyl-L-alanyl-D-glutamate--2,6-diaminopimelate ligase
MMDVHNIEKRLSGLRRVLRGRQDLFRRVVFDSRQAGEGDLFVAVRGTRTDGHRYIAGVVSQGVAGVCCETLPPDPSPEVTWFVTENSARALGELASLWYGEPSARFRLTGVTGTNGKTSIATSLYHLFRAMGYRTGLFATTGILIDGEEHETTHTTPDPLLLNEQMALMAEKGVEYVFMEVSSHAADQERIAGLRFSGGIFTNLSQDHLDYHKDFRSYLYAKKKFFDMLPEDAFALVNADDRNGRVMLQNTKAKKYTYGIKSPADFQGRVREMHFDGTLLQLAGKEVWIPFVGEYSASNMTAVYAAALLLGADEEVVLEKMSALPQVPGRFEVIRSPDGVRGVVDYAHTPDAVGKVLKAIRQLCRGGEKVLAVLGAGGNRDRSKRPRMARLAYELSDVLILTSDNPREEDPGAIIEEMLEGLTEKERKEVISNPDRREAIRTAVRMAHPGDIILVAGKGHEDYQEIKGVKHHFDDREVLRGMMNVEG